MKRVLALGASVVLATTLLATGCGVQDQSGEGRYKRVVVDGVECLQDTYASGNTLVSCNWGGQR